MMFKLLGCTWPLRRAVVSLCRREMLPNAWCQGPMDEPTWQEKEEDTREGKCR